MKKNFLVLLMMVMSFNVFADKPIKIGFIRLNDAFTQLHDVKEYLTESKKEEEKIVEAENKARAEIEVEMTKMEKMDEKAKVLAQKTLGTKINTLQQKFTQERSVLEQKNQAKQADVQKKIPLLIEQIRKEGNYDLILHGDSILAASDAMKANDKTTAFVEKYNTVFKVKPEAKPSPAKTAPKK